MSLILSRVTTLARSKNFFTAENGRFLSSWKSATTRMEVFRLPICGMPARSFSLVNLTAVETASNLVPSMVTVQRYGEAAMVNSS